MFETSTQQRRSVQGLASRTEAGSAGEFPGLVAKPRTLAFAASVTTRLAGAAAKASFLRERLRGGGAWREAYPVYAWIGTGEGKGEPPSQLSGGGLWGTSAASRGLSCEIGGPSQ